MINKNHKKNLRNRCVFRETLNVLNTLIIRNETGSMKYGLQNLQNLNYGRRNGLNAWFHMFFWGRKTWKSGEKLRKCTLIQGTKSGHSFVRDFFVRCSWPTAGIHLDGKRPEVVQRILRKMGWSHRQAGNMRAYWRYSIELDNIEALYSTSHGQ